MLQNLISNAIKYTPKGRILVGCRRRGNEAIIHVIDTGLVIAPSKQKLIFKEFKRLSKGSAADSSVGLGLSIVDRIAKLLGHRIDLASTAAPDRASCSRHHRRERSCQADRAATRPPGADDEWLTALVVDNEPAILDAVRRCSATGASARSAPPARGTKTLLQDVDFAPISR